MVWNNFWSCEIPFSILDICNGSLQSLNYWIIGDTVNQRFHKRSTASEKLDLPKVWSYPTCLHIIGVYQESDVQPEFYCIFQQFWFYGWVERHDVKHQEFILFRILNILEPIYCFLRALPLVDTSCVLDFTVNFSSLILTTHPGSFLTGLISLFCGCPMKFYLWSFNIIKHSFLLYLCVFSSNFNVIAISSDFLLLW